MVEMTKREEGGAPIEGNRRGGRHQTAHVAARDDSEDFCCFGSALTLSGSAAVPFVISTEAQRSGEISVLMLFPGNVQN
jgi:hypothetical protein